MLTSLRSIFTRNTVYISHKLQNDSLNIATRQAHNYTRSMNLGTKNFSPNISNKSATTGSTALSAKATMRQELRKNYTRDGYLVAKNLFSPAEIETLQEDIVKIVRGKHGPFEGYILAEGSLRDQEAVLQYSRIEHPHKISSDLTFNSITHPKIVELLTCLVGPNVKCMSSKLYITGPGERGRVWHQDELFIPTRDRSLLCAIIAIDDLTIENGQHGGSCILAHPASHRSGVLYPLRSTVDTTDNDRLNMNKNDEAAPHFYLDNLTDSESGEMPIFEAFDHSFDPDAGVPLDIPAGSVAFINGYTMQRMLPNIKEKTLARALKVHYCSAESWLPWNMDGKVPMTADNRDIFMVAGRDPYASKGITPTLAKPKAHPNLSNVTRHNSQQ